jgi:hypothetical protein
MKRIPALILLALLSMHAYAQTSVLRGQVTDESGAVVPGSKVTLNSDAGVSKSATTGIDGTYSFPGLAPGVYTVQASATDLALPQPGKVTLRGGVQTLNLLLKVSSVVQQVTVQESTTPTLTPDPASNASALVLKGDDLQALSDDPDDLQSDLMALAGPAAGPDGGSIYVDGFSNGQLPPKDSIREIRINQNPFSPEFEHVGFGRIEIFTKPGADKFRGQGFFNFADDVWNSRNPYAQQKAPFLLKEYGGTVSGPLNKRASFVMDVERRAIDNGSVVDAVIVNPTTLALGPFSQVLTTPQRRFNITPRIDYQLNQKHTLMFRYGFFRSDVQDAGIGNFNLVSRGYHSLNEYNMVHATDTNVVNANTINETRFYFYHSLTQTTANSADPALLVLGSFNGGGAQTGRATDSENYYELQNYTTITHGAHSWRFGARLRGQTIDNVSPQNFGGTFTFGGGLAPQLDSNNQPVLEATGQPLLTPITSAQQYQRTLLFSQLGYTPTQIRALGGGASQFTITAGNPQTDVHQFDVGAFVGDDWRLRPSLTLSLGLRWESQTNIHDHSDFAPRLGIAWAPGSHAKSAKPKTVIRGGFGIFYSRFGLGNTLTAQRYNGIVQQQYVITNPDFYPTVPPAASLAGFQSTQIIQEVYAHLHAPYLLQSAATVERQLPGNTTLALTFTDSHGLHQFRSEDINPPLPGTYNPLNPHAALYPYGTSDPIFLMDSSGLYNQNQVIVNANSRMRSNVSLFGYYMLTHAKSNTDGLGTFPSNPYNYSGDYGPASTAIRNTVFFGGSVNTRWNIRFSPFLMLQSGVPYDITVGHDLYGDTLFNGRPGFATNPNKPGVVDTAYGLLDPNPTPDERLVPRNYGHGPAIYSVNMRLGKTWGFGPVREGAGAGPSGPGGPGGPGGGMRNVFAPITTNRRYNLTVSLSARNLLNHTNPGPIIGNIASPLFGQANQIAGGGGGGFAETANNRRLELQMRFSF